MGRRFKNYLIRSDLYQFNNFGFVVAPRGVKFACFIYYALGIFKIVIDFEVMESELVYIIIGVSRHLKKDM